jgi:DNA-binding protein H-NS
MGNARIIWNHESKQANGITKQLLGSNHPTKPWRIIVFPLALMDSIRGRLKTNETCKNLLYTKQLAFSAAEQIVMGHDKALELGAIDSMTREVLKKEQKGLYTEKIRKKQLMEIALLVEHYVKLLSAEGKTYDASVQEAYQTGGRYQAFFDRLEKRESEVIQAAVSSVRKGSKKKRVAWFKKVQDVTRDVRLEEINRIFPDG